jgi:hypothetical protein
VLKIKFSIKRELMWSCFRDIAQVCSTSYLLLHISFYRFLEIRPVAQQLSAVYSPNSCGRMIQLDESPCIYVKLLPRGFLSLGPSCLVSCIWWSFPTSALTHF